MEGVAVFLLGVDGLHTGFYHAGYFIMSISAMRGFALGGGGGDHWERRERGKKKE